MKGLAELFSRAMRGDQELQERDVDLFDVPAINRDRLIRAKRVKNLGANLIGARDRHGPLKRQGHCSVARSH